MTLTQYKKKTRKHNKMKSNDYEHDEDDENNDNVDYNDNIGDTYDSDIKVVVNDDAGDNDVENAGFCEKCKGNETVNATQRKRIR